MNTDTAFWLRFWGVRGTLPVAGASTLQYGGNTSCVEVHCAGHSFILDAGSGIKLLGDALQAKHIDILLSHTHIDHILGIPFFTPAYDASRHIRLWAGHLKPQYALRDVVGSIMRPPIFPLTPADFKATMEYTDFTAGETLDAGWKKSGVRITTLPLAHPDRATGYRIEFNGKALCYITDYEHTPGTLDGALVQFISGARCLIYDSTYTDEEFGHYQGWGHSTWQQAVRLADAAGVKTLVIFHHDPDASDTVLNKRAVALEAMRPGSVIAEEGVRLMLN